jgi:hypothetical protein
LGNTTDQEQVKENDKVGKQFELHWFVIWLFEVWRWPLSGGLMLRIGWKRPQMMIQHRANPQGLARIDMTL